MIESMKVLIAMGITTSGFESVGVLARQFLGLQGNVDRASKQIASFRTLVVGLSSVKFGENIEKGIWNAIAANRELNTEIERTKQLGGEFAANVDKTHTQVVKSSAEVPMFSHSEGMRLAKELGPVLQHPDLVNDILTQAEKTAFVISNATGENREEIMKNLMKTADTRAAIYSIGADGKEHVDQAKLMAEFDAYAKALKMGNGMMNSADLLQVARQGGVPVKTMSPEAFSVDAVEAGIQMGFSKFGTALTGLFQQFVGGTMKKAVAEHLTEAGLLKSNEWHSGKSGGVVINGSAAGRFEKVLQNPEEWATTGAGGAAIRSYAAKEHISAIAAVLQLFGKQTVQRLVAELQSNAPQFQRAHEIFGSSTSVNQDYKELMKNELDPNIEAVAKTWKSLMEELSNDATPLVIPILEGITHALHYLAEYASKPENLSMIQFIIKFAAGLGAVFIAVGTIATAIGVVGLVGLGTIGIAAGLTAIGVALGAIALVDWLGIEHSLESFRDKLVGLIPQSVRDWVSDKVNSAEKALEDTPYGQNAMKSFDPTGSTKMPAIPQLETEHHIRFSGKLTADGKDLTAIVNSNNATDMNKPQQGYTGYDPRMSYPIGSLN